MLSLTVNRHEEAQREWRRWRRARRRRDRDAAIFALWSLCEPEIWRAAAELAGKLGEAAGRRITVSEWRLLHGLDEDDVRYGAVPATAKAAKGYDPARGASFQTYAYAFILGELRSSIVTGDVLNDSGKLIEATTRDPAEEEPREEKPDMWSLLELNPHNGGPGKYSDRGVLLDSLDADTLTQIRTWLEENKERAIAVYGYGPWMGLRADVGILALLERLPPNALRTDPFADKPKDGLTPLQGVAVRVDGKKWDLDLPIRAELLRGEGLSGRATAKRLGIAETSLRDMHTRATNLSFSLSKFTPHDLDAVARGKKRGRPPKS